MFENFWQSEKGKTLDENIQSIRLWMYLMVGLTAFMSVISFITLMIQIKKAK